MPSGPKLHDLLAELPAFKALADKEERPVLVLARDEMRLLLEAARHLQAETLPVVMPGFAEALDKVEREIALEKLDLPPMLGCRNRKERRRAKAQRRRDAKR